MSFVTGLRCRECEREYPIEPLNVCDFCFGPLETVYDYDGIARIISRERIARGLSLCGGTRTSSPLTAKTR